METALDKVILGDFQVSETSGCFLLWERRGTPAWCLREPARASVAVTEKHRREPGFTVNQRRNSAAWLVKKPLLLCALAERHLLTLQYCCADGSGYIQHPYAYQKENRNERNPQEVSRINFCLSSLTGIAAIRGVSVHNPVPGAGCHALPPAAHLRRESTYAAEEHGCAVRWSCFVSGL